MALSERQEILAHLVRVDAKFDNPKDLLTYLAVQLSERRSPIRDQREYLNKLVSSGYESTMAKTFYDDYKSPSKTVKDAAKSGIDSSEPEVEPDPPQELMENPETITE